MLKNKNARPTEGELEILAVLWDLGKATVREVFEEISKTKEGGYTTTLKLMQIMLEKGYVERDSSSKTHIYEAIISKENTQKQFVGKLIDNLFAGSSSEMVLQALGGHKTSTAELEKIEALISMLKKQN